LEPLLATPLTAVELLFAKTASAFVVALALAALGHALLIGVRAVGARPGVAGTPTALQALALVGGVAPAAMRVALTLGAILSLDLTEQRGRMDHSHSVAVEG
jgi:ABC-type Na+ efflux pump permease subunit